MGINNKKFSASLATTVLAVAMLGAAAPSASANTAGDCVFDYSPHSTYTYISSVSCTGGHTLGALISYYASDNTTRVSTRVGPRVSFGTSYVARPAGSFLYGNGVSYL